MLNVKNLLCSRSQQYSTSILSSKNVSFSFIPSMEIITTLRKMRTVRSIDVATGFHQSIYLFQKRQMLTMSLPYSYSRINIVNGIQFLSNTGATVPQKTSLGRILCLFCVSHQNTKMSCHKISELQRLLFSQSTHTTQARKESCMA